MVSKEFDLVSLKGQIAMDFSKGCLAIALAASATTACTSGMGAVRESIASAPEWYQDRAKEVRGEGYPSIGRIPTLDAGERSDVALTAGREDVLAAEELFRMDPRAVPAGLELETMLEWAKEAKSAMAVVANQPSEHLTDEEIAALKALFEAPRAKS